MSANDNETTTDIAALRNTLIDQLKTNQLLTMERVEAAFRAVPRHLFLPDVPLKRVYSDRAIPTKFQNGRPISSSSQPAIMAIMLEQLDLRPGQRVLEIGAGTGYNAALMAHLVGEAGAVTTVDLDEDTAVGARANLKTAGFEQVKVVCGDGMMGYAEAAPYDRIILTVGGWDITPHWLAQLKEDGRILLPLSINGPQLSVAFDRQVGHLVSASVKPCGFMRIRGDLSEPQSELALGPDPGLSLETNYSLDSVDPDVVFQWLMGPHRDQPIGVQVTPRQLFSGLLFWLSLNEPRLCNLVARGDAVDQGIVPYLMGRLGKTRWVVAVALLEEAGLSVLMRPPDSPLPPEIKPGEPPPSFALYARSFGSKNSRARRLIDLVQAWDKANRPGAEGLRIRAYPVAAGPTIVADEQIIKKQWHQFIIDYSDD